MDHGSSRLSFFCPPSFFHSFFPSFFLFCLSPSFFRLVWVMSPSQSETRLTPICWGKRLFLLCCDRGRKQAIQAQAEAQARAPLIRAMDPRFIRSDVFLSFCPRFARFLFFFFSSLRSVFSSSLRSQLLSVTSCHLFTARFARLSSRFAGSQFQLPSVTSSQPTLFAPSSSQLASQAARQTNGTAYSRAPSVQNKTTTAS